MLRNVLLFLSLMLASGHGNTSCPKICKCNENSAICNAINFTSFNGSILKLKIFKPFDPLIIKENSFNVTGLKHLNAISIEHASILDIKQNAFSPIPALSSLNIINSNIPRINNPLIFAKSDRLRILKISNSALRKFESIKSDSIEELDLSGNHLTAITKNTFENLSNLIFINLERNDISSVDSNAFSNLPNLQDVILANNNITNLSSNLFQYNTELIFIDLSQNPLKNINFNIVAYLEKLVLSSCQLRSFGATLAKNLTLLNYLDLSNNSINFPSDIFNDMKELEYIDLSNSHLTDLDPLIFQFNSGLQKIILDNNNFVVLLGLQGTSYFETYFFSCKNCGITKIAKRSFKFFPSLVILHLSHNKINGDNLAAVQELKNLMEIDLSYNNISSINPFTFTNLTELNKINLAGNPLKSINPAVFQYNNKLKTLDVSFCGLTQLWQQLPSKSLNSILDLNVANNSLTTIGTRDLQVIPYIQSLDLSNNPLLCGQVLYNTMVWLTEQKVEPVFTSLKWKTNEELTEHETEKKNVTSWQFLANDGCLDENRAAGSEDQGLIIHTVAIAILDTSSLDANDNEEIEMEYDDNRSDLFQSVQIQTARQTKYSFLWPTLVFIFTALSVLTIAANVLLLLLRSRAIPLNVNIPHIKIPGWNSNNRLKKHSGSVYRPLSEERPDLCSITKNDYVPTHTPKSSV